MKKSQRIALMIFCVGILVFLTILFWSFVYSNIILPFALTIWLLLRVFVLSADQINIWMLVVISGGLFILFRLRGQPPANLPNEPPDTNYFFNNISLWRIWIQFGAYDEAEKETIRRELTFMLVSMYKSRQHGTADFEVVDAMKHREIVLPEPVYEFLFPAMLETPKNFWLKKLRLIQQSPRKWIRSWTGRDVAEYYVAVEAVLNFMETSLELTHGPESYQTGHD
jgi:hypothetical protein